MDCGRTAPRHEHPIIYSSGCVCWSLFVDCNVSISMVKGLRTPCKDGIFAEQDLDNEPNNNVEFLPILPHMLVKTWTFEVSCLIFQLMPHLIAIGWAPSSMKQIEWDHRDLLRAYNVEPQFASSVNRCSVERTSFDKGWTPTNGHFEGLREFSGGLATMFPNTTPVGVDFSVVGWEKNDYWDNLTDFSLKRIIHVKQYKHLHTLVWL